MIAPSNLDRSGSAPQRQKLFGCVVSAALALVLGRFVASARMAG